MTLENYKTIFLKRWQILVMCVVVMGLGAYIGGRLMTPAYQSSVLMRVTVRGDSTDINNLQASNQLGQTVSLLVTSSPILSDVASRFPGLTVDQLKGVTTTSYKANTQLFEINVTNANPKIAAALANDIANTLIKQQTEEILLDNNRSQQHLQHEVDSARQSMDAIQKKINDIQLRIADMVAVRGPAGQIAALQAQMSALESQFNNQQQYYNQWQTLLTQLRLTEAQNSSFLHIAQPAEPATSPVRPQIPLNTGLGIVAGLFLGLVMMLLFEQLDTRTRTADDLGQILHCPLLCTILNANSAKEDERIIINPEQKNINYEQYRILRTNIGFAAVEKPIRSLVVTSAMPNDGKSTVAANLAIFMARAGKRTLLIDANLRRSSLHKNFLLQEKMKGFSDAIMACSQDQSSVSDLAATPETVHHFLEPFMHSVEIDNLSVMPAGSLPPNPSELLDSTALSNLLSIIASSDIDMIIFDTLPLLGLADTRTLVSKVDGTVLVVDITCTTRKKLLQVKTLLQQSGARIIGCVVNKQGRVRGEVPYYYYYDRDTKEEQKAIVGEHMPASSHSSLIPVGSKVRKKSK
jgi:capsular exopolysaccharide synthesis family protein